MSGIQNNFNPTRNSESARRNAPDSVHGGEIRDIKCNTGQPNVEGGGFNHWGYKKTFQRCQKGVAISHLGQELPNPGDKNGSVIYIVT